MARELFIGLMSGTSLDGVDAVLLDFAPSRPVLIAHAHYAFAADLRHELLMLNSPGWDDLHRAAVAAQHLVRAYAAAVEDVLLHADVDRKDVRAVGAPGQTVRHRPDAGYTLQVNAPALLAELAGIDVVADLRSRDVAAGGQGAPLVPALHAALFTGESARAIVNIGGIANITGLPARSVPGSVIGFDCGPGNVLIDGWMQRHRSEPVDRDGLWASGRAHEHRAARRAARRSVLRAAAAEEHRARTVQSRLGRQAHRRPVDRAAGRADHPDAPDRDDDRRRPSRRTFRAPGRSSCAAAARTTARWSR